MNISLKELLILILKDSNPVIKYIIKQVMILDRADFPFSVGESLDILTREKLIYVEYKFPNGTPLGYNSTEAGKILLEKRFKENEIFNYINSMQDPSFLLELTKGYITKNNSNSI